MPTPAQRSYSRVWIIRGRAGPFNKPQYMANMMAGTPSQDYGDVNRIEAPSPSRYGDYVTVGETRGAKGRATMDAMGRYPVDELSVLQDIANGRCKLDLQVHFGSCQDPGIFHDFDKIVFLSDSVLTNWTTDANMGSLESGEQGPINEQSTVSADRLDEGRNFRLAEQAKTQVAGEIVDVLFCDSIQCGDCGPQSDGCQHAYAISKSSQASPTSGNDLLFTRDGGSTWTARTIPLWNAATDPTALACAGPYLVVLNNTECSIGYVNKADFESGTYAWQEIDTGLVCSAGAPNAIKVISPSQIIIVGDGGYIYLSEDITNGVEALDAGNATTEDLFAVDAFDENNIVAVGANNAVVFSADAGDTWQSVTGPAVGVVLNTVLMHDKNTWLVGTANGKLYATQDQGETWTEKTFYGSGSGSVRHITQVPGAPEVKFMAHNTAAPAGRILVSYNGGYSWEVAPLGNGTIPTNQYINKIAACSKKAFFAGGLGVSTDGIIIKGSAA